LLGLGLVRGATGRPAEALDPLNRAVDAAPSDDEARFARAEVLEQLGRTEEARRDYARVAQESPREDLRRIARLRLEK
jgi:Flp pilus assembly protein TadD